MTPKFCPHCGTKAPQVAANFCPSCGESLNSFQKKTVPPQKTSARQTETDEDEGDDGFTSSNSVPQMSGLDVEIKIDHRNVFQIVEGGVAAHRLEIKNSDMPSK